MESLHLMVQHVVSSNQNKPAALRRKMDKSLLEEASKHAALVHALQQQALETLPASPQVTQKIDEKFVNAFINNDLTLQLELQTCCHEIDANLSWKSITVLKDIGAEALGEVFLLFWLA